MSDVRKVEIEARVIRVTRPLRNTQNGKIFTGSRLCTVNRDVSIRCAEG